MQRISDSLVFWLSNYTFRRWLTKRFTSVSQLRSRLFLRVAMYCWEFFGGPLDYEGTEREGFRSLHECFTRRLKPGGRVVDRRTDVITAPCDGVIGAHGTLEGLRAFQVKGMDYRVDELVPASISSMDAFHDGSFVTLRLTSTMYHRLHAPADCTLRDVHYVSGDVWNVNPITLQRVAKLYCRNERVVIPVRPHGHDATLLMIPVAAVLVASIKLHCLPKTLDLRHRGARHFPVDVEYSKGEEIGYFQHGSTVIMIAPAGYDLAPLDMGETIRMGRALFKNSGRNK